MEKLLLEMLTRYQHEVKMGRGITCKIFLYKSILGSACLWSRVRLTINKKQKYFSLADHQLTENLILDGFYERKTKG